MKSELIVDVQPQEIAIALTEDDRLQEVSREQRNGDNFSVGNIYYGRVRKVMPALNAVFVDVGYQKEAFLHYLDLGSQFRTLQAYVDKALSDRRRVPQLQRTPKQPEVGKSGNISEVLKVGDNILVQVSKEPINTKGPRLTAEISIAGRNMVLIPLAEGVMVSQKIKRESERSRLKQLISSIKPQGFGVIVRTVAEDKRVAELDSELRLLVQRWEDTVKSLQQKEPVSLVSEELGRTIGVIRDVFTPDFTSIQVNDKAIYDEVRQYVELIAPDSAKIVKLYDGVQPIFDKFDITRQMKTGLGRVVGFKHGGYLIIDRTEALFSIDVNSGSKKLYEDQEENAFQFNMLAAEELVHQLRLRDIGGIIIVDFIDMDSKEHQQQLYDYVRRLMSRDRAKHNVLPLSKFGLMQITRQRVRPAVEVDVMEVCPTCMGKGKIQPSILFTDEVEEEIKHFSAHYGKGLRLHLHPYIYSYVSRGWWNSLKHQWRRKYGVCVVENQGLGMLEMRFYDAKGNILQHSEEGQEQSARPKVQPKAPAKPQAMESVKAESKETAKEPIVEAKSEPRKAEAGKVNQKSEAQAMTKPVQSTKDAKNQSPAKAKPEAKTEKVEPTKAEEASAKSAKVRPVKQPKAKATMSADTLTQTADAPAGEKAKPAKKAPRIRAQKNSTPNATNAQAGDNQPKASDVQQSEQL